MTGFIVLDEFHLTVCARRGLPERIYGAIRASLDTPRFRADLRKAVGAVFLRHPPLRKVRVRVTR